MYCGTGAGCNKECSLAKGGTLPGNVGLLSPFALHVGLPVHLNALRKLGAGNIALHRLCCLGRRTCATSRSRGAFASGQESVYGAVHSPRKVLSHELELAQTQICDQKMMMTCLPGQHSDIPDDTLQ